MFISLCSIRIRQPYRSCKGRNIVCLNWGEPEWVPHRCVVCEPCLRVCMHVCYHKYTLLQLTKRSCYWWFIFLNCMYQSWIISLLSLMATTLSWTRMETKDNSDGATVCQQRWQEIVVKTSGVLSFCSPMPPAMGTSYVYRTSTMAMRHPQWLHWVFI